MLKVLSGIISWLTRILSYIGTVVLLCLMLLTTADVFFRYLFNSPILGVYEVTEFMMVSLVFMSLAFTQTEKGHVAVDILVTKFKEKPQLALEIFNYTVSSIILIFIAWKSFEEALGVINTNQVSPSLSIPVYPFYFLVALGSIAMAFELLRDSAIKSRELVRLCRSK